MALHKSSELKPLRLGYIEGHMGKMNEVLYHPTENSLPMGCVIFFGGDLQDYKENMLKHRDNKHHAHWDLESTSILLHHHFPNHVILIIKPYKMSFMTFSCYENFIQVNDFGAPTYIKSIDSLMHLQSLLSNIEVSLNCSIENRGIGEETPIKIIGFSKGCIVLNQFLYSLLALKECPDDNLKIFIDRVSDFYWLEGGHSGTSETWITNRLVLENFACLKKTIHIHLTPFQICDEKPRIEIEEKKFRKTLIKMGCDIKREFHFADQPRSMENHFRVLEVFKKFS